MSNTEENIATMSETSQIYEAGIHFVGNLSAEELQQNFEEVKATIQDRNGQIISEEFPERITLAYPMERSVNNKNETHGQSYFGWVKFESEGELAEELLDIFRSKESVLRSLVTKTSPNDVYFHQTEDEEDESEEMETEESQGEETSDAAENAEETANNNS